jgi:hypothetical protein
MSRLVLQPSDVLEASTDDLTESATVGFDASTNTNEPTYVSSTSFPDDLTSIPSNDTICTVVRQDVSPSNDIFACLPPPNVTAAPIPLPSGTILPQVADLDAEPASIPLQSDTIIPQCVDLDADMASSIPVPYITSITPVQSSTVHSDVSLQLATDPSVSLTLAADVIDTPLDLSLASQPLRCSTPQSQSKDLGEKYPVPCPSASNPQLLICLCYQSRKRRGEDATLFLKQQLVMKHCKSSEKEIGRRKKRRWKRSKERC